MFHILYLRELVTVMSALWLKKERRREGGRVGGMGSEFMAEQPGQCWSSQDFKVNNNSKTSQKNSSKLLVPTPEI